MRMTYLDEGGISYREPFFVVAGAIIHYDDQLVPLLRELQRVVGEHIPEPDHDEFEFHATDIFSGTGYFKDRKEWPWERRIPILVDLLKIPVKLDIPCTVGFADKEYLRGLPETRHPSGNPLSEHDFSIYGHAIAFHVCALNVEKTMRYCFPSENTMLIAANRDDMRLIINETHSLNRRGKALQDEGLVDDHLPLQRIQEAVYFNTPSGAPALQLADAIAFINRGYLSQQPRALPLYEIIRPVMTAHPKDEVLKVRA